MIIYKVWKSPDHSLTNCTISLGEIAFLRPRGSGPRSGWLWKVRGCFEARIEAFRKLRNKWLWNRNIEILCNCLGPKNTTSLRGSRLLLLLLIYKIRGRSNWKCLDRDLRRLEIKDLLGSHNGRIAIAVIECLYQNHDVMVSWSVPKSEAFYSEGEVL